MKKLIACFSIFAASACVHPLFAFPGGPTVDGTINVTGDIFLGSHSSFLDAGEVVFLEINYDGVAPMVFCATSTNQSLDTEIGLYDSNGVLVAANDNFYPDNLFSKLRFFELPAGQFFLAVGLFDTTFEADFNATSNSNDSGNIFVEVRTLQGFPIALDYNFNGIVHADEPSDPTVNPDDPYGFRSIADRALDFRMAVPSSNILDRYALVEAGGELDMVHLGNRNTVSNGLYAFDPKPDSDGIGIQPNWLGNPDQTGRRTSSFSTGQAVDRDSYVSLLFQISDGGGSFDVVVGNCRGDEFVTTVSGPDWLASGLGQPNIGAYAGAFGTDFALPDLTGENALLITQVVVDLSNSKLYWPSLLSFGNGSNSNAGVAILAANIYLDGPFFDCPFAIGDMNNDGEVDLLDVAPFVQAVVNGSGGCEADSNADGCINLLDIDGFIFALTH